MTIEEKRKQVADQYRAIAHMATAIAGVHTDLVSTFENGRADDLLDLCGLWSAQRMEILGDMLNGMDAVDDNNDAWMGPVFDAAHLLWPAEKDEEEAALWRASIHTHDGLI